MDIMAETFIALVPGTMNTRIILIIVTNDSLGTKSEHYFDGYSLRDFSTHVT